MKKLSFILTLLCVSCVGMAQTIPDTAVFPLAILSATVNHKFTVDLNPTIAASPTARNHSDSIKTALALAIIASTNAGNAITSVNAVKLTADSGRKINSQQEVSLSNINNIAIPAINNGMNNLQTQINNISGGGTGFTVPVPYNVTGNIILPQLPYNTDIVVKCNKCTVTFTTASPGWHYRLHNLGTALFNISFTGVSPVNYVKQMGVSSRELDVSYLGGNTVEVH